MIPVLSCSCLLSQRQTDTGFPVGYRCEFCPGLQELLVLSALRSHLQWYPTIPFFIASVKLLWKYVLKETGCKTHLKTFFFSCLYRLMSKVVAYKKHYSCNLNKHLSFKFEILNVHNHFNPTTGICQNWSSSFFYWIQTLQKNSSLSQYPKIKNKSTSR